MLNSLPVGFDKLCRPLKLEGKAPSVEDLWPGVCLVRKLSVRHYGEGFEIEFHQDPFGECRRSSRRELRQGRRQLDVLACSVLLRVDYLYVV